MILRCELFNASRNCRQNGVNIPKMRKRRAVRFLYGLSLALLVPYVASASEGPPNIVVVVADDLGFGDVGFNGNKSVQTPELDTLANEGVLLRRFYSGAPVCTPTRASVLTGRNAFRSNTGWANSYPLPDEEVTVAEVLRVHAYRTGFFGKWHLGKMPKDGRDGFAANQPKPELYMPPWKQGFDVCFAAEANVPTYNPKVWPYEWLTGPEGVHKKYILDRSVAYGEGTVIRPKENFFRWPVAFWRENGEPVDDMEIAGDSSKIIMDQALAFIVGAVQENRPFFAEVAFMTPHSPIAAGNSDRRRYATLSMREQHWYGSITAMDRQIGRLRNLLRDLEIDKDTFVIFFSDNGPSWVHELNSAGPFRGQKGDLLEGGIHVPAVVEWPGHLKSKAISVPISTDDLLPTLARLAGIALALGRPLDGEDVLPILQGRQDHRTNPLYFHSYVRAGPEYYAPSLVTQSAIIDGVWKLLTRDGGKSFQLYNLENDQTESSDLSTTEPHRVAALKKKLLDRIESFRRSAAGADYSNSD